MATAFGEELFNYDFKVELVSTSRVRSPIPSQDSWLAGSNIDLTVPPISPGHFFVYKPTLVHDDDDAADNKTYEQVVGGTKKALSQCLGLFYPVAGRFRVKQNGEAEIECNNQGVEFREARADVAIKHIDFSQPSLSVGGKLSPTRQPLTGERSDWLPVLAVQVTRMKCGGVVVGCSFDHRIVDGVSSSLFFKAWSEAAQGRSFSFTPSFQRSLVEPRRPLNISTDIDKHYMAIPFHNMQMISNKRQPPPPQIGRIYHLDASTLQRLQSLANQGEQGNGRRTKMEAVSAYIWRLTARAQGLPLSQSTRIGIPIDGRAFLNLPHSYFGNAITMPFTQALAEDVLEKPLSKTAGIVHDVIRGSTNTEYFRSVLDWVEAKRPAMIMAKVYAEEGSAVVISSGVRIPIYEVDLGWGKPAFSSAYFPWGGTAGYVMLQASPLGEGNWVVYMHMAEKDLDAIEADPDFLFVKASHMGFW